MATNPRKKVVVVGLGMVGISFIEKLLKLDAKAREYDIEVFGEETHLAYNRVGLTTYFSHRQAEKLYLNPREWYDGIADGALRYHTGSRVAAIDTEHKTVRCEDGRETEYDILVLATGSDAVLPRQTPGHDAQGVFVYRNIADLERLIAHAGAEGPGGVGAVVGGGLLGLEAAKAMLDLGRFDKVVVVERNGWVLSRQLDGEAGGMVVESVRALGVEVQLGRRVSRVLTEEGEGADGVRRVSGVEFEDGATMALTTVCFAIGVRPRDELARTAGLECAAGGCGGGVVVGDGLQTSAADVYAVGECASWQGQTFGLIGPGVEMADVLAFNLTQAKLHRARAFRSPDVSTRLKLLGVEVASFGDYFADRDGPRRLPAKAQRGGGPKEVSAVKALTYKDPFGSVYKKYIFTADGRFLLGGMMIGDTQDYVRLVPMVTKQKEVERAPGELMLGAATSTTDASAELDDDTQICSCHNVSKGAVVAAVRDGGCTSLGAVKACTKAGTGCGGCVPLVTSVFAGAMAAAGNAVSRDLCAHFRHSRADLYHIVAVRGLGAFADVMAAAGVRPDSVGCEVCRPAVGSILASQRNGHVMRGAAHALQDTNDRWLGNMQRDGTFSVVPRVAAGEITPARLVVLGEVARDFGLYSKITGGQRIDLFGARKQDLPAIWRRLVDAGMESGHAYAKSLRTVKSCVGTTWCRYGVGDAVGLAVRLEERYKSIRGPHKIKGGVSGCVRECAEAQSKDFGLIATEKGFNIYVGGNGGATPRHAELLARDVAPADVVPILDRFLALYIRTADRLQRTARWIEGLPGGVGYLRDVVVHDKLGLAGALEAQMEQLVGSYFDEWAEALRDPALLARFRQFANTDETLDGAAERETERQQQRPAFAPRGGEAGKEGEGEGREGKDSKNLDSKNLDTNFAALSARWSSLAWQPVLDVAAFERLAGASSSPSPSDVAAAAVKLGDTQLAVFRVRGRYYATQQMCPHKRAFVLSDGLIGDDPAGADEAGGGSDGHQPWVSCPLHKRNFDLASGVCRSDPASGLSLATFAVRVEGGRDAAAATLSLLLPPPAELDAALGTARWRLRAGEAGPPQLAELDRRLLAVRRASKVIDRRPLAVAAAAPAAIAAGGGLEW